MGAGLKLTGGVSRGVFLPKNQLFEGSPRFCHCVESARLGFSIHGFAEELAPLTSESDPLAIESELWVRSGVENDRCVHPCQQAVTSPRIFSENFFQILIPDIPS